MNRTTLLFAAAAVIAWLVIRHLGQAKPDQAQALLRKGARVIDVRTAGEYQGGHLKVAVNIPLDQLKERIGREVPDLETPILLHCASGARSGAGKHILTGLGYRTVLNLGSFGRARAIVGE